MTALIAWFVAHWPDLLKILGALYALLSLINGLLTNPTEKLWIGKILDGISFLTRKDSPGTLKLPFKLSKPKLAAALLPLLFASLFLSACLPPIAACKSPTPANVAKCNLEHNLIACGESSGLNLLPVVLDLIASAIGGAFDPSVIAAELEGQGFKDVPCVLAAIESYLLPTAPAVAARVHLVLVYQLSRAGKHGQVSIKLKNGTVVNAVAP